MMNLTVPDQLVLGQSASLLCNYDLEGTQLYSVKWYKNGQEFFRYMPSMDEQFTVFNIPGVHVIHPTTGHSYRNFNKMQLNHVDMETGGVFRCEVSNEFPDFHTVSKSVELRVVAIPSGPIITPQPLTLAPGDRLEVNCTVRQSLPRPHLLWYINRVAVEDKYRREIHYARPDGTEDTVSTLGLNIRRNSFEEGRLLLKCSAILENFFFKSDELEVRREGNDAVMEDSPEGKILGLFDDDAPYREKEDGVDSVRIAWTSSSSVMSAFELQSSPLLLFLLLLLLSFQKTGIVIY